MTKVELFNSVSRTLHKTGFKLKKHSPEIMLAAGIVGTVVSAVVACKATLKVKAVVDETKDNVEVAREAIQEGQTQDGQSYDIKDYRKDLAIHYAHAGLKLAKIYGPAIGLGTLSILSIVKSHDILSKRNVALAAAYAIEAKGFKEYRGRVIERFGKDLDQELRHNIKAKEIETIEVNEKGEETVVKKTVKVADPNPESDYARFFDEYCAGWEKDAEHNLYFLRCQQAHANDLLKERGHVYLNEVYDMLGIKRTKAGQIVGWVYNEEHPVGDNYIDFGIYDIHNELKRDFVNGRERSILLDFNVDGNILELMS
jgi:hypothetical protein